MAPVNDLTDRPPLPLKKRFEFLINYINEKGLMERHKTAMLKSIFQMGTTPIKDIMVPETSIISINLIAPKRKP